MKAISSFIGILLFSLVMIMNLMNIVKRIPGLLFIMIIISAMLSACGMAKNDQAHNGGGTLQLFAGCYTDTTGNDIHVIEIDTVSDMLSVTGGIRVGDNPSFLFYSASRELLYAINETDAFQGYKGGGVSVFNYNTRTNTLKEVSNFLLSGSGPCHISADQDDSFLFVACYGDGSLSVVANDKNGIPEFEAVKYKYGDMKGIVSHPHMASMLKYHNLLAVSDLGYGRLNIYRIFYSGSDIILREEPGFQYNTPVGPRHFVTDSMETTIYLVNELSSELSVLRRSLTGKITEVQRLKTFPDSYKGSNFAADIHWSPDMRFLYVTNRGHNSIAVFKVDDSGNIRMVTTISCEGDWPRNFAISPGGKYMVIANQRSGTINLFRINTFTGVPEYTGSEVFVNSPSCVIFNNNL